MPMTQAPGGALWGGHLVKQKHPSWEPFPRCHVCAASSVGGSEGNWCTLPPNRGLTVQIQGMNRTSQYRF